ncbi:hypothetical protein [Fibrobacter sp.]|uniref:hypothetical protein n=1 Tax=Fibrobacter sp. TaxID=35828 RepID=UPI00386690FE
MQQDVNFNYNLFDKITKLHGHLLSVTDPILRTHKNCDKLELFERRILIKENNSPYSGKFYKSNHFIAFYKTVIQSANAIKEISIPEYDLSDIDHDSNLLFSSFFQFASDLYFCLKSVLLFINKHERANQSLTSEATKSLNVVQSIITQCIHAIPQKEKIHVINGVFSSFGISPDTSFHEIQEPLTFDNSWYNARLQEYKNFVLNGICNTVQFFPFELWLFNKYKNRCSIENNPRLPRRLEHIEGLGTYCAYADNEEKLFKNINDYIIAYFFDFKKSTFKTQSEFVKLNNENHGEFRDINWIKEDAKELYTQKAVDLEKIGSLLDISQEILQVWKNEEHWDEIRKNTSGETSADETEFYISYLNKATSFYSTIGNVAEAANALLIYAIINYPIFLNKERTRIIYTNREEIEKFTNITFLIKHTFGLKEYPELAPLNEVFKKNFALNQDLLEKWPSIPFMLYWVSHFIEYKDFKKLFYKVTNAPKGVRTQIKAEKDIIVDIVTWKKEDEKKTIHKEFMGRDAQARLQLMFFFALFDITEKIDLELNPSYNNDWFNHECSEKLQFVLYKALVDNTWKDSNTQSQIFSKILSILIPNSSISVDFSTFTDNVFHATETAIVLIHGICSYARNHSSYELIQLINFIDEQRAKTFEYYGKSFDDLTRLGKGSTHKEMLIHTKKMKGIDKGFYINITQKSPTFENQYFSRRIPCKIFQESDTQFSYLESENQNVVINTYEKYYRAYYKNFINNVYLNEERNVNTHYSLFKPTRELLKPKNCVDLLLLLFDIRQNNSNEKKLRNLIEKISLGYINQLHDINFINLLRENVTFSNVSYSFYQLFKVINRRHLGKRNDIKALFWMEEIKKYAYADSAPSIEKISQLLFEIEVNSKEDKGENYLHPKIYRVPMEYVPSEWIDFYKRNTPSITEDYLKDMQSTFDEILELLEVINCSDKTLIKQIKDLRKGIEKDDIPIKDYFKIVDELESIYNLLNEQIRIKYDTEYEEGSHDRDSKLSWFRLCDDRFDQLISYLTKPDTIQGLINRMKDSNDKKQLDLLIKGKKEFIDKEGTLIIDKARLKQISDFIEPQYPFDEDLQAFLNTMFGVTNICRVKRELGNENKSKKEIAEEDVSFLDLYGYESELYLIKVLIQIAQVDLTDK